MKEFFTSPLGIGIAGSLIGAAIVGAVKWGKGVPRKIWYFLTRYQPHVPRETLRLVLKPHETWWHLGSVGKEPAMQVVSRWYATNITDVPVQILGAFLTKPRTQGLMVLVRHPEENIYGRYEIQPHATTEMSADFWVQPPIRKIGDDFVTGVVILDQFGNEHKVKNVVFKGPKPKEEKPAGPPEEPLHSIEDPIEKEVAAVLKAEVSRYRQCGRRVGGLGSVQTIYENRTFAGIGTEWREADSPKNQSIVRGENAARIESDNADALENLYNGLGNDDERLRCLKAMLKRLSRDTEYAPVGYLIMLVAFRIGQLPEALALAKANLQKDGAYGFSDLMRLLDGLLRFKHHLFSSELLDDIERFLEGVEEHTFGVRERIAAIRAYRLAGGATPATNGESPATPDASPEG